MPLSEHVYCVVIAFKAIEQVEQWICIKFCIKLEHSSAETIQVIQKSSAMGNWWLAASSQQWTHSCVSCRAFWQTSNPPGDSAPLQPRFGALRLLAFPKTKITFERGEISDHQWDSGKYDGAADRYWENCVWSQSAYSEGDWGIIVLCTVFLVSCIFFKKCLFFILHGWIPSGQTSHIYKIYKWINNTYIMSNKFSLHKHSYEY